VRHARHVKRKQKQTPTRRSKMLKKRLLFDPNIHKMGFLSLLPDVVLGHAMTWLGVCEIHLLFITCRQSRSRVQQILHHTPLSVCGVESGDVHFVRERMCLRELLWKKYWPGEKEQSFDREAISIVFRNRATLCSLSIPSCSKELLIALRDCRQLTSLVLEDELSVTVIHSLMKTLPSLQSLIINAGHKTKEEKEKEEEKEILLQPFRSNVVFSSSLRSLTIEIKHLAETIRAPNLTSLTLRGDAAPNTWSMVRQLTENFPSLTSFTTSSNVSEKRSGACESDSGWIAQLKLGHWRAMSTLSLDDKLVLRCPQSLGVMSECLSSLRELDLHVLDDLRPGYIRNLLISLSQLRSLTLRQTESVGNDKTCGVATCSREPSSPSSFKFSHLTDLHVSMINSNSREIFAGFEFPSLISLTVCNTTEMLSCVTTGTLLSSLCLCAVSIKAAMRHLSPACLKPLRSLYLDEVSDLTEEGEVSEEFCNWLHASMPALQCLKLNLCFAEDHASLLLLDALASVPLPITDFEMHGHQFKFTDLKKLFRS